MRKEIVENAGMTSFAEIGLIIFVIVFLAIFLRAILMNKDDVKHLENLPLEDGQDQQLSPREEEVEA